MFSIIYCISFVLTGEHQEDEIHGSCFLDALFFECARLQPLVSNKKIFTLMLFMIKSLDPINQNI